MAAKTKCLKLSDFKQQKFILRPEVPTQDVSKATSPPKAPGEGPS